MPLPTSYFFLLTVAHFAYFNILGLVFLLSDLDFCFPAPKDGLSLEKKSLQGSGETAFSAEHGNQPGEEWPQEEELGLAACSAPCWLTLPSPGPGSLPV